MIGITAKVFIECYRGRFHKKWKIFKFSIFPKIPYAINLQTTTITISYTQSLRALSVSMWKKSSLKYIILTITDWLKGVGSVTERISDLMTPINEIIAWI